MCSLAGFMVDVLAVLSKKSCMSPSARCATSTGRSYGATKTCSRRPGAQQGHMRDGSLAEGRWLQGWQRCSGSKAAGAAASYEGILVTAAPRQSSDKDCTMSWCAATERQQGRQHHVKASW